MTADSVYIHVPFCIHRCGYCDFTVIAGRDDLIEHYLKCLELEIARSITSPQPVSTIFIGGGTPSYLPEPALQQLLTVVNEWFPLREDGEFSMECNPDGLTLDKIKILRSHSVNRISLGVQSFNPQHLETLERTHLAETINAVFAQLRDQHFANISLDLIFAVPGQTLSDWEADLKTVIALAPEHVSTYGLTFEKGTQFWTRRMKSQLIPAEDELEREMYSVAMTSLPAAGFQQYELSNFAQPGMECRHNQVYWQSAPYFGFGPGAASYLNGVRAMRHRSVTTWIRRVIAGESGIAETEVLNPEDRAREAVMLGLRQVAGIDLDQFQQQFSHPLPDLAPNAFDRLIEAQLLTLDQGKLRLTKTGRFIADSIMAEFL
ncbi:Oxygen-independent coproporphyrinogen-III oxidase 1 [Thalassoglobus neptunius]|uniref:Heme chaperone HemW n=1 Tax=Thalassoglobus neptunius TaxID=1938619 RepID=A0A5C5VR77_9PLAN|nr:radical SAM family heme chaperone HemW [Thalassoglobus neptunius]TWT40189.1 Oxygen-independent coproporphyrinogen-III oxidase 1 [Thalassoglobus neptunius]